MTGHLLKYLNTIAFWSFSIWFALLDSLDIYISLYKNFELYVAIYIVPLNVLNTH